MRKEKKVQLVDEVSSKLEKTDSFFLVDFRGLTVIELHELRGALRDIQSEMQVVKNTLLDLAFKNHSIEGLEEYLIGPTAIVWSESDPIPLAKSIVDFSKEHEHLQVKVGILDGEKIGPEKVVALSRLPSRESLLAQVVYAFESPISGLVFILEGQTRELVMTLQAIADQKQQAA